MENKITVVSLVGKNKKPACNAMRSIAGRFEKDIRKDAPAILKILNKDNVAIDIYLAGNVLMRRLNKKYRGKDKAANVLSFVEPLNFPHPETKIRFLGEIYLNINSTTNYKLWTTNYLLVHAILHLLGYTHKGKSDRIKMEKKENHVHHLFRHRNFAN